MQQIHKSLEAIRSPSHASERAEEVQMIFSLPYDPQWRKDA